MEKNTNKLKIDQDNFIAYQRYKISDDRPSIIFLGGLMSDMEGTKALAIDKFCKEKKYNFIRFDYYGHGKSSGNFVDGTISRWRDDTLAVLDNLSTGKQIIIGSSLGGWLMILAALKRKEKVAALIGIASAPDFTDDLIWNELDDKAKKILESGEIYNLKSDYSDDSYPIKMDLIKDGRDNFILNSDIDLPVPVRLIHGGKDLDVPSNFSILLSQKILSDNVKLDLLPDGDHRMSSPDAINLLLSRIEEIVNITS